MDKLTCDSALVDWALDEAVAVLETMGLTVASNDGAQIRCNCPWGLLGTDFHIHGNQDNPAYIVTIAEGRDGHRYMRGWCNACTETRTALDKLGSLYRAENHVQSDDIEELLYILRYAALTSYADDPASLAVYAACGEALLLCTEHHLDGGFSHYDKPVAKISKKKGSPTQFYPYPEGYLNTTRFPSAFTSSVAMNYLHKRGVPDWVTEELDIRYDSYMRMVCFPYYAKPDVLAGVRGRSIYDDSDERLAYAQSKGFSKDMKHSCYTFKDDTGTRYSNTATTWYRQAELKKTMPIIVCEGAFDAARIYQVWENTTAIFTQSINDKKLSFLSKLGKGGVVIVIPDNDRDDSGNLTKQAAQTRQTVRQYFESRNLPFMLAELPETIHDPASFHHIGVGNEVEYCNEEHPACPLSGHDPDLYWFIDNLLTKSNELFPYPKTSKQQFDENGEPIESAGKSKVPAKAVTV